MLLWLLVLNGHINYRLRNSLSHTSHKCSHIYEESEDLEGNTTKSRARILEAIAYDLSHHTSGNKHLLECVKVEVSPQTPTMDTRQVCDFRICMLGPGRMDAE